jgi:hypothetical protein
MSGSVLGVDVSEQLLERARQRTPPKGFTTSHTSWAMCRCIGLGNGSSTRCAERWPDHFSADAGESFLTG